MNIVLTKEISETIKKARKEKNLTQQKVAEYLGLSFSSYNRIENNTIKKISEDILDKIIELFHLDYEIKNSQLINKKQTTIRIPIELFENITYFQHQLNFSTTSETIIYMLHDYMTNIELANHKYELQDFFERMILQTFGKELQEMHKDISKYKHLLDYLAEKYQFDQDQEQQLLNIKDIQIQRAKK